MSDIDLSELTKLAVDLSQEGARVGALTAKAVKDSGQRVQSMGRANAPVRSGALRDSIGVDTYGDGRSKGITVVVGPSVRYGRFPEYGTAKTPPHPYMQPAFAAEAPRLEATISAIAGDVLK